MSTSGLEYCVTGVTSRVYVHNHNCTMPGTKWHMASVAPQVATFWCGWKNTVWEDLKIEMVHVHKQCRVLGEVKYQIYLFPLEVSSFSSIHLLLLILFSVSGSWRLSQLTLWSDCQSFSQSFILTITRLLRGNRSHGQLWKLRHYQWWEACLFFSGPTRPQIQASSWSNPTRDERINSQWVWYIRAVWL